MKVRKSIGLILSFALLFSVVVTGCGKSNTSASTQSNSQSAVQPAEKKVIKLTVATWDASNVDDPCDKILQDKCKVQIVCQPLSWDDYVEKIKLWAASNTLPDMIDTNTVEDDITRFYGWIDQGLIRSIPENLINKYPTEKSIFASAQIPNAVKKIKGAYYSIPKPATVKGYYTADWTAFYYRKDWAANVGITSLPKTTEDFYQMLKAFTNNDPDKNGKNDTFGLTSPKLLGNAYAIFGVNPDAWIKENGKFVPSYISNQCIDALKFYRKLYDEHILDPEFAQSTWKQSIAKFAQNKAGVLLRNADVLWMYKTIYKNYGEANKLTDPTKNVGMLSPIAKDANTPAIWPLSTSGACSYGTEISSKVDDEKLDRILSMYEWMLTDGRTMLRLGIENKDYKMVNGKPQVIPQPEGAPSDFSTVKCLTDWDFDNDIEANPDIPAPILDMGKTLRDEYNPIAFNENWIPRYMSTPTKDTLSIVWSDEFTKIVIGKDDVEKMFNDFVTKAMNSGLSKAIDEVNQKCTELGVQ